MKQTTHRIVMIRPEGFRKNEQTSDNSFQAGGNLDASEIAELAREEFDCFVDTLRDHGVDVLEFETEEDADTPDAVFPNNWLSFHDNSCAAIYPMKAENRRAERREALIYDVCNAWGLDLDEVLDFTEFETHNRFLEGTGSMVLDRVNKLCYAALSERTDEQAVELWCEQLGYTALLFSTYHRNAPIYHTNVVLSVGTHYAVVASEVIPNETERSAVLASLRATGKTIVEITAAQLERFAANLLEVSNDEGAPIIVMSKNAYNAFDANQRDQLAQFGTLLPVNLNTIETYGGGSARCMLCEVFLPQI